MTILYSACWSMRSQYVPNSYTAWRQWLQATRYWQAASVFTSIVLLLQFHTSISILHAAFSTYPLRLDFHKLLPLACKSHHHLFLWLWVEYLVVLLLPTVSIWFTSHTSRAPSEMKQHFIASVILLGGVTITIASEWWKYFCRVFFQLLCTTCVFAVHDSYWCISTMSW